MRVLQRYIGREVFGSVFFVLLAFLALFAFFELIGELPRVGRGNYRLHHAFLYILMGFPGYIYDLMPIAALIGTIYSLSQLAARSEFTIMRASGMSTAKAGWILAQVGAVLVVVTFLFGELIAPVTSEMAEKLRLDAQDRSVSQQFRSGLWTKDVIRQNGVSGNIVGSRFFNVREVRPDGQLRGIRLYEFSRQFHLTAIVSAGTADYQGEHVWRLNDVSETKFAGTTQDLSTEVSTSTSAHKELISEITPEILSVVFSDPNRMSVRDLAAYTRYLEENNQSAERYQIAFWKKLIYPLAILVMMALALPFAYLHFRSGGVSLKIFIGIMIGVSFQLINSLFSHIGLLNTWPAFTTAIVPSAMFLLVAIGALWWVQHH